MSWIPQLLIAVLAPVILVKIYDALYMTDYFKNSRIYYHEPGPCHLIAGVEGGSEDVETISDGTAFISSGVLFTKDNPGPPKRKGRIFMFDFNKKQNGAQEIPVEGKLNMATFAPHGLSTWEDDKTGEVTVFVVNHPTDKLEDVVEKFIFDRKRNVLKHVISITSPAFRVMNDVVATSGSAFYATNYFNTWKWANWERYLRLSLGSVVYFDGENAEVAIDSLRGPNGLNISPDGKTMYVASFWDEQILLYNRFPNNSLSFKRAIDVQTRPDNIKIDKNTGDIWIGAHPLYYRLSKHKANPTKIPTPSQVLRIKSGSDIIEEVYSEDGVQLFGSTVAERYGDAILIGSVYHKLLYCELKHLAQRY